MKRKEFLIHSGLALGATMLGSVYYGKEEFERKSNKIDFDLHAHPGVFFAKGTALFPGEEAFVNRILEMKANNLDGAFFSLVADWPLLQITDQGVVFNRAYQKDEGWIEFKKQLSIFKELLQKSEAVLTVQPAALGDGESVKAFLACEGGDFIGTNLGHVEEAYDEGVRSIQIVHYAPNLLGDLQTWKSEHGGLSKLGGQVIKKMNQLGMIIDVAHASARTVKMAVDLTKDPVILSHSILKDDKERPISARAISVEHAKMVSVTGGVIGIWPSGFSSSFDEFIDHTFRMIDAVGINHVGIGTDMDANFQPVISSYHQFSDWKSALSTRGLTEEEIGKIAGNNMKRVLDEVL